MSEESSGQIVQTKTGRDLDLPEFENRLLALFDHNGLPSEGILVSVAERNTVFGNIGAILARLSVGDRQKSIYISKFLAAVASGLFDAALNYLWDETVLELRRRVAQYDLSYFYDNAVSSPDKRKDLKDESDLDKIQDSELILGAKGIGLISELGYKQLDYIKYMRNWASAAHPNQHAVTGLELCAWLERCIIEVISLPLSNDAVEIKKLLANVRANAISATEAKQIGAFFASMPIAKVNNLTQGFFGIYTRSDTTPQARQNIHLLLPMLWDRVDEDTRNLFGVKFGRFAANNEQQEMALAKQFLETVGGLSYMPDNLRAAEMLSAIENLLVAHRGLNNFYSEPTFAKVLEGLVGAFGRIPPQANNPYVYAVVEVFLTNGNGVAWYAEPIYRSLLDRFDAQQALIAILSFDELAISSKLQFSLCQQKFRDLLGLMKVKVSAPAVKELIEMIERFSGPFDRLKDDSKLKSRVANLKKIL